MPGLTPETSSDMEALDQASDWLVRIHDGGLSEQERLTFDRWLQASEQNQQAWQKAELLMNKLGFVPSDLAMPTLNRSDDLSRRAFIGKLALLLFLLPASWGSWHLLGQRGWLADHRTPIGERQTITLSDGSQLYLNTDTAVNVAFSSELRLVSLVRGEILINTGQKATLSRPFRVQTQQGMLEALGTRFSVHQLEERTLLRVTEGRVSLSLNGVVQQNTVLPGEEVLFTAQGVQERRSVKVRDPAWMKGMLEADRMTLAEFAQALGRYRKGVIHYDPSIAELKVSGAYPITDTDLSLNMLTSTYPVRLQRYAGGYWVSLKPE